MSIRDLELWIREREDDVLSAFVEIF